MKLLGALTELFLNAFQITRPRPEQQRTAKLVIGGLMLLVLLLVAGLIVGMLVWPSTPETSVTGGPRTGEAYSGLVHLISNGAG